MLSVNLHSASEAATAAARLIPKKNGSEIIHENYRGDRMRRRRNLQHWKSPEARMPIMLVN